MDGVLKEKLQLIDEVIRNLWKIIKLINIKYGKMLIYSVLRLIRGLVKLKK